MVALSQTQINKNYAEFQRGEEARAKAAGELTVKQELAAARGRLRDIESSKRFRGVRGMGIEERDLRTRIETLEIFEAHGYVRVATAWDILVEWTAELEEDEYEIVVPF